jgi:hypothetical protein
MTGHGLHRIVTAILSLALMVIGIAMVVTTITRGGGPISNGVILGALFFGAGVARLMLQRSRD